MKKKYERIKKQNQIAKIEIEILVKKYDIYNKKIKKLETQLRKV